MLPKAKIILNAGYAFQYVAVKLDDLLICAVLLLL